MPLKIISSVLILLFSVPLYASKDIDELIVNKLAKYSTGGSELAAREWSSNKSQGVRSCFLLFYVN